MPFIYCAKEKDNLFFLFVIISIIWRFSTYMVASGHNQFYNSVIRFLQYRTQISMLHAIIEIMPTCSVFRGIKESGNSSTEFGECTGDLSLQSTRRWPRWLMTCLSYLCHCLKKFSSIGELVFPHLSLHFTRHRNGSQLYTRLLFLGWAGRGGRKVGSPVVPHAEDLRWRRSDTDLERSSTRWVRPGSSKIKVNNRIPIECCFVVQRTVW